VSSNNPSLVGFNDFKIQIPKPKVIAPFRLDPMLCFIDDPGALSDMGASANPVSCSDVLSNAEPEMVLQSGHSQTSWQLIWWLKTMASRHGPPLRPPSVEGLP
jgi:hypothetical protein